MSTAILSDPSLAESSSSTVRHRARLREVQGRRRYVAAGMGALAPILANLLLVDPQTVFTDVDARSLLGWGVRIVILFAFGAAAAWLYREENSPLKLFQLGVAMPALITALANGQNIEQHEAKGVATAAPASHVEAPALAVEDATPPLRMAEADPSAS